MDDAPPGCRRPDEERNALVEANLSLVHYTLTQLRLLGHPRLDDLRQEGMIGLLSAAVGFDKSRGFHFSTYAVWAIKRRVQRALWCDSFVVHLPAHLDAVARAAAGRRVRDRALPDAALLPAGDGGQYEALERAERDEAVREAVGRLHPAYAEVMRRRLDGEDFETIGREMGFTRSRAQQLEKRAKEMLKARNPGLGSLLGD